MPLTVPEQALDRLKEANAWKQNRYTNASAHAFDRALLYVDRASRASLKYASALSSSQTSSVSASITRRTSGSPGMMGAPSSPYWVRYPDLSSTNLQESLCARFLAVRVSSWITFHGPLPPSSLLSRDSHCSERISSEGSMTVTCRLKPPKLRPSRTPTLALPS